MQKPPQANVEVANDCIWADKISFVPRATQKFEVPTLVGFLRRGEKPAEVGTPKVSSTVASCSQPLRSFRICGFGIT